MGKEKWVRKQKGVRGYGERGVGRDMGRWAEKGRNGHGEMGREAQEWAWGGGERWIGGAWRIREGYGGAWRDGEKEIGRGREVQEEGGRRSKEGAWGIREGRAGRGMSARDGMNASPG